MKRRHVWAATAMLASAGHQGAWAANGRTLRLGLLWTHEASRAPSVDDAFLAELAKHGYERGRNLAIEGRSAHRAGVDAAAAELVALKVDVIYAMGGTAPALSAKRATSSIPIVFTSADPVAFGLVSSLAHPGGNLTGISIQGSVITAKQMEAMAEALGSLRSMAYIHAADAPSQAWFASFVAAATPQRGRSACAPSSTSSRGSRRTSRWCRSSRGERSTRPNRCPARLPSLSAAPTASASRRCSCAIGCRRSVRRGAASFWSASSPRT
jgi:hypothetical protein